MHLAAGDHRVILVAGIGDDIERVLLRPRNAGAEGFDALESDGSTRAGLSEQVLAAMARETLTRAVAGVTFNEITAHRDEDGQLTRIEVDYLDEIHDPSSRSIVVKYPASETR